MTPKPKPKSKPKPKPAPSGHPTPNQMHGSHNPQHGHNPSPDSAREALQLRQDTNINGSDSRPRPQSQSQPRSVAVYQARNQAPVPFQNSSSYTRGQSRRLPVSPLANEVFQEHTETYPMSHSVQQMRGNQEPRQADLFRQSQQDFDSMSPHQNNVGTQYPSSRQYEMQQQALFTPYQYQYQHRLGPHDPSGGMQAQVQTGQTMNTNMGNAPGAQYPQMQWAQQQEAQNFGPAGSTTQYGQVSAPNMRMGMLEMPLHNQNLLSGPSAFYAPNLPAQFPVTPTPRSRHVARSHMANTGNYSGTFIPNTQLNWYDENMAAHQGSGMDDSLGQYTQGVAPNHQINNYQGMMSQRRHPVVAEPLSTDAFHGITAPSQVASTANQQWSLNQPSYQQHGGLEGGFLTTTYSADAYTQGYPNIFSPMPQNQLPSIANLNNRDNSARHMNPLVDTASRPVFTQQSLPVSNTRQAPQGFSRNDFTQTVHQPQATPAAKVHNSTPGSVKKREFGEASSKMTGRSNKKPKQLPSVENNDQQPTLNSPGQVMKPDDSVDGNNTVAHPHQNLGDNRAFSTTTRTPDHVSQLQTSTSNISQSQQLKAQQSATNVGPLPKATPTGEWDPRSVATITMADGTQRQVPTIREMFGGYDSRTASQVYHELFSLPGDEVKYPHLGLTREITHREATNMQPMAEVCKRLGIEPLPRTTTVEQAPARRTWPDHLKTPPHLHHLPRMNPNLPDYDPFLVATSETETAEGRRAVHQRVGHAAFLLNPTQMPSARHTPSRLNTLASFPTRRSVEQVNREQGTAQAGTVEVSNNDTHADGNVTNCCVAGRNLAPPVPDGPRTDVTSAGAAMTLEQMEAEYKSAIQQLAVERGDRGIPPGFLDQLRMICRKKAENMGVAIGDDSFMDTGLDEQLRHGEATVSTPARALDRANPQTSEPDITRAQATVSNSAPSATHQPFEGNPSGTSAQDPDLTHPDHDAAAMLASPSSKELEFGFASLNTGGSGRSTTEQTSGGAKNDDTTAAAAAAAAAARDVDMEIDPAELPTLAPVPAMSTQSYITAGGAVLEYNDDMDELDENMFGDPSLFFDPPTPESAGPSMSNDNNGGDVDEVMKDTDAANTIPAFASGDDDFWRPIIEAEYSGKPE